MSFRLILKAKDGSFESELREAVNKESEDLNPQARRALGAAADFVRGAPFNLPAGTTIGVDILGEIENVTGYGEVTVKVTIEKTPPDVAEEPAPAEPEA